MTKNQQIRWAIWLVGYVGCMVGAIVAAFRGSLEATLAFLLAWAVDGVLIMRLLKEIE